MAGANSKPSPFAIKKLWPPTRSHCRKLFSVLRPFNRKKRVDNTGNKSAGVGDIAGSDLAPLGEMDGLVVAGGEHVDGTPMETSDDDASTGSDTAVPELMDDLTAGREDGTPMATSGDDASTSSNTAVPELMDDLVAEILLRLHLDHHWRQIRVSLVCKRWHGILSDPYFRNRYKEFHRSRLSKLQQLRETKLMQSYHDHETLGVLRVDWCFTMEPKFQQRDVYEPMLR
ncbi:hypothetical protein ACP70R_014588 [Stipagrostis hirtigluma subsp. patula]